MPATAVEDGFSVVVVAFVVAVVVVVVALVVVTVVVVVVDLAATDVAFAVVVAVVVIVVVSASVDNSSVVISSVVVVVHVIFGIGTAAGAVLLFVSKAIPPKPPLAIDCSGKAVSRQPQSRTITHNIEDIIFTPVFFIQPPSVSTTIHYVLYHAIAFSSSAIIATFSAENGEKPPIVITDGL